MSWLLPVSAPLLFVLPGLLPARVLTGRLLSWPTLAWAVFFSVLLLPVFSFGLAMALHVSVGPALVYPLAAVLGLAGVLCPRRFCSGRDS